MKAFLDRSLLQKIALIYAVILAGAASLNYLPFPWLRDDAGLICGVFALDPFDDLLHVGSALWALYAGWRSTAAAKFFLVVFGALYLGDGAVGFVTAYGYLDLGILRFDLEPPVLSFGRIAANLPHIALGGYALWAGLYFGRRA